jgi:IS5 family transposase
VRVKKKAKVEFGSTIYVRLVDGYNIMVHMSWDSFNEGAYLMDSVDKYRKRHGFYPSEV